MSDLTQNPKRQQFIDDLLHSRDVNQTKQLYSQWAHHYEQVIRTKHDQVSFICGQINCFLFQYIIYKIVRNI